MNKGFTSIGILAMYLLFSSSASASNTETNINAAKLETINSSGTNLHDGCPMHKHQQENTLQNGEHCPHHNKGHEHNQAHQHCEHKHRE